MPAIVAQQSDSQQRRSIQDLSEPEGSGLRGARLDAWQTLESSLSSSGGRHGLRPYERVRIAGGLVAQYFFGVGVVTPAVAVVRNQFEQVVSDVVGRVDAQAEHPHGVFPACVPCHRARIVWRIVG